MKITCIQMDVQLGCPDENYRRVSELIGRGAETGADVLVLPETWNTGFFPREGLREQADIDGVRTKALMALLSREHHVNLVCGSVATLRKGHVYNTAYVCNAGGSVVAEYDKLHLFTPMGEDKSFSAGDHLCRFELDGVSCGLVTCYDIRFPELTRILALQGIDVLFLVSQWPAVRIPQLRILCAARAIENQMYLACCNACGKAGETVYGGSSAIYSPLGETLALGDAGEALLTADCNLDVLRSIRSSINVFADRREDLYQLKLRKKAH